MLGDCNRKVSCQHMPEMALDPSPFLSSHPSLTASELSIHGLRHVGGHGMYEQMSF